MKNEHSPSSNIDAIRGMLERHAQGRAKNENAVHFVGPKEITRYAPKDLKLLGIVGERSHERTALPRILRRWPLTHPKVSSLLLRVMNRITGPVRVLAADVYHALRFLHDRIDRLERAEIDRANVAFLAERVTELEARLRAQSLTGSDVHYLSSDDISSFMERVAERFRGDPAQLRQRMGVHLDVVRVASQALPGKPLLDLGCGHGEWLALMRDVDVLAEGVDLSHECVTACAAKNLTVRYGDAMEALDDAAPDKLSAVTAFHLVEHLPLEAQIALFNKAYAALAPGGLFLLETPNPVNLHMIGSGFWHDPTHSRPVPAQLLKVFAEAAGFSRVETHFINAPEVSGTEIDHYPPRLRHMLFCGQDTALYAWK